jgi:hypothetical protein
MSRNMRSDQGVTASQPRKLSGLPKPSLLVNVRRALATANKLWSRALPLFFHSRDVLAMLMRAVTVQGWTEAQEKLEGVAEVIAIVAVERIGAVVDGKLGAETNVDTFAM